MTKRMLIDSSHAEETRVVLLDGNRLEDYDFETAAKRQLKGNIYLAKIVRVEPSLQAAFVEYGGNRHGFLAFGEIHPDYFQIPVADRRRLVAMQEEEAEAERAAEEREDREAEGTAPAAAHAPGGEVARPTEAGATAASEPDEAAASSDDEAGASAALAIRRGPSVTDPRDYAEAELPAAGTGAEPDAIEAAGAGADAPDNDAPEEDADEHAPDAEDNAAAEADADALAEAGPAEARGRGERRGRRRDGRRGRDDRAARAETAEADDEDRGPEPESLGGERDPSADRDERRATQRMLRSYKIQEVIRRRQIILVQVVKEERGSKGAALTTFISLAGRFCVLMPNSPRGGGVSRKITSAADRKRLKEITAELEIPRGMAMIVRTAGAGRPRPEIRRDCEYLLRTWDDIRDTTMASMAPSLIYEEASLIKRAIRDSSGDVEEITVDGEAGYRAARDFMSTLMPDNVGKVRHWRDSQPLFARHNVEGALDAILSPNVQLRSGGYLVINQTEALVAIDVNSGRSTRERGIEETALRTNLEAADEVARQLRLRDLAGLIVIDFIDMESRRNNAAVEKRMKDALRNDRARIQIGAISHFGLMELSRQRLRPSLAESSFVVCSHCNGTGLTRGIESAALHVLRAIEVAGAARDASEVAVHAAGAIALYVLNQKRDWLMEIEARTGMQVRFEVDDSLAPPAHRIVRTQMRAPDDAEPEGASARPSPVAAGGPRSRPEAEAAIEAEPVADRPAAAQVAAQTGVPTGAQTGAQTGEPARSAEDEGGEKRRRRRRRRRGGKREGELAGAGGAEAEGDEGDEDAARAEDAAGEDALAATEGPATAALAGGGIEAGAPGPDAPDEGGEGGERRRRTRGRRRGRRDEGGATGADAAATDDDTPARIPAYSGPTPADPFGGAFDIFDVLAEREEQYLANPASSAAAAAATAPDPVRTPEPMPEAPEAAAETAPAATAPDPASVEVVTATVEPVAEAPEAAEAAAVEAPAPRARARSTTRTRRAPSKAALAREAAATAAAAAADGGAPLPEPVPPGPAPETMPAAPEGAPPPEPEDTVPVPDPASGTSLAAVAPTAAPEAEPGDAVPAPDPAPATSPEAAPVEVKPILVGAGEPVPSRRAGWWKR